MSGQDYQCSVCKKHYLDPGTEMERKLRVLEKWGPILTTMDQMMPICPACERKVIDRLPKDYKEKLQENLFKSKRN